MNRTFWIFSSLLLLLPAAVFSQKKTAQDPAEQSYEWRIRQEVLFDTYIPRDVSDAILQLNRLVDEPSKAKFKAMSEDDAARKLFFSLGRWMTHNWSLYEGSRLSAHLQDMGIHQPDNMARFLVIVFHRSLNKKPLEVKALLEKIQEKEELDKQDRLKKGTILHEEKRKVTSPPDGKNE